MGTLDGVDSIVYDQIWRRSLSAGVENGGFKFACLAKDCVPPIYIGTNLSGLDSDIFIEELCSIHGQLRKVWMKKNILMYFSAEELS